MPTPPLHKIGDFRQSFPTFDPTNPGTCRIRLFASAKSGSECHAVVIISQAACSAGSVTNFIEEIATEVLRTVSSRPEYRRVMRVVRLYPLMESRVTWIEHYPPGSVISATQERFCQVTFQNGASDKPHDPQWWVISRLHLEHCVLRTPLND